MSNPARDFVLGVENCTHPDNDSPQLQCCPDCCSSPRARSNLKKDGSSEYLVNLGQELAHLKQENQELKAFRRKVEKVVQGMSPKSAVGSLLRNSTHTLHAGNKIALTDAERAYIYNLGDELQEVLDESQRRTDGRLS